MYDGLTVNGKFCQAIAFAEGCIHKDGSYNTNHLSYKLNNPGDLKATSSAYTHFMTASGKLQFLDIGTGWNALAHQVDLMFTNKSAVYRSSMSIQDVANHYAKEHDTEVEQTNANNWAKNVAAYLKCEITTTLDKLVNPVEVVIPTPQEEVGQVVQAPPSKWPGKR